MYILNILIKDQTNILFFHTHGIQILISLPMVSTPFKGEGETHRQFLEQ